MKKKVRKLRNTSTSKKKASKPKTKTPKHKKSKTTKKKVAKAAKKKSYRKTKPAVQEVQAPAKSVSRTPTSPVTASSKVVPITAPKRPAKYLNNKDLLAEVISSKKVGKMSDKLAKMLQLLTLRYGKKGNFANYTYNDDMQSYAMLMICKTWQGFDPAKSSNPFAWFTQCIKNSFIQYLNYEKRERDIRDKALVDVGLSPSYNYQYEYSGGGNDPEAVNVNVEHQEESFHNSSDNNYSDEEESHDDAQY